MITKHYIINTFKINTKIKISIFSDIHYSNIFNPKKFKRIKQTLTKEQPNYILIPGDIIDSTIILNSKENCKNLLNFFKEIGTIAPTYISLGNHDYTKVEDRKNKLDIHSFWYKEFKTLKKHNVILLNNEIHEEKDIRIIGYTLPYSYYYQNKYENSLQILIKDFNKNIKYFDNQKLNILLCHSPVCILDQKVITDTKHLKNIDLIISGHMHNGMIPNFLNKIFPKNRGIIAPNKKLYPNNARGIKTIKTDDKEITLIISGGITKIQETAPRILHFANYLYDSQIETLIINN